MKVGSFNKSANYRIRFNKIMKKLKTNFYQTALLLSDEKFHDGTSIGKKLNITRAGVWKAIKKLEEYGIQVQSVKGKGYALTKPLLLLDEEKIKQEVHNKNIDLECFETIDSTNDYLGQATKDHKIKVCIAEHMSHGKGRLQRSWYSPFGLNIYMSLLYPLAKDELSGLSLVVGLSLCKTINDLYKFETPVNVKWPNDIIWQGKKLAGNLIEIQAESNGFCYAIIGVGINVNLTRDIKQISQPWTSISKISNQYIDRNILCSKLLDNLINYIKRFETHGFEDFLNEWRENDGLLNKVVSLKTGDLTYTGKVSGINNHGHLLITTENGKVMSFSSGDASIIKAGL